MHGDTTVQYFFVIIICKRAYSSGHLVLINIPLHIYFQHAMEGLVIFKFNVQWGKKVFSQPPIVQVLPLKKMREACNFHHRYTSTMRDKIRKKIQKITLKDF